MRVFIIGAGHMGSWLTEELCHDHEVAVFDIEPKKLKHFINVKRFLKIEEVKDFNPELVINCVSLNKTEEVFETLFPFISDKCIISDIASVKDGLHDFYKTTGRRFVSTHPMFGPTFGNVRDLSSENVIIISESDNEGKEFFCNLFRELNVNIYEYTFNEHDEIIAYSLSTPFASSLVFAACMKKTDAPGTTFKKHMEIAKGLLSEDDFLISEILFNPHTLKQIESINSQLSYLTHIIKARDSEEMEKLLTRLRGNIK
ncbi:MAG: prephenate dehydrogenase/arogenate dehydrogenase family protein [Leptospirales bacterium]|nr:prephenate dehydrogenase/arogenate dehydrogenase family protein [Leptospirales bacterium]